MQVRKRQARKVLRDSLIVYDGGEHDDNNVEDTGNKTKLEQRGWE